MENEQNVVKVIIDVSIALKLLILDDVYFLNECEMCSVLVL